MKADIDKAIEVLRNGGIILYPTDTIWGIGCDATNPDAVKKVYELKQRADSKSMLVLIDNAAKLQSYVDVVPDVAYDLIGLSDKPLTIIFDGAKNLAPNLPAEDGSVGIRITTEAFSKTLCQRFRKPIVSTSANISGNPSPVNFAEIDEKIKNGVDFIVEYRQHDMEKKAPSGIIKLGAKGEIKVIRQ
ncbi:MAG: L-threonylcarbamoyladenylate synthase [Breznakibacter sp.]